MLFVSISFALGSQSKHFFWWNIDLNVLNMTVYRKAFITMNQHLFPLITVRLLTFGLRIILNTSLSLKSIKDRQQEVRAILRASRYIEDCYMALEV